MLRYSNRIAMTTAILLLFLFSLVSSLSHSEQLSTKSPTTTTPSATARSKPITKNTNICKKVKISLIKINNTLLILLVKLKSNISITKINITYDDNNIVFNKSNIYTINQTNILNVSIDYISINITKDNINKEPITVRYFINNTFCEKELPLNRTPVTVTKTITSTAVTTLISTTTRTQTTTVATTSTIIKQIIRTKIINHTITHTVTNSVSTILKPVTNIITIGTTTTTKISISTVFKASPTTITSTIKIADTTATKASLVNTFLAIIIIILIIYISRAKIEILE